MDGYFQQQALNGHFSGPVRQRGSALGSLALRAARFAMPFVSKYIIPAAKRIGKEFAKNMLPEVVDIASGKTNVKKAVKRAATTTVKKQLGGGPKRSRAKSKPRAESISSKRKTKTSRSQTKRKPARTKIDIFKNLHN